ncbi:hypothetical protein ACIQ9Q_41515 [Streptomyces sp. NPDC094438]
MDGQALYGGLCCLCGLLPARIGSFSRVLLAVLGRGGSAAKSQWGNA